MELRRMDMTMGITVSVGLQVCGVSINSKSASESRSPNSLLLISL
jgi:hypothetical protein